MRPFLLSFFVLSLTGSFGCAPKELEEDEVTPHITMTANKEALVSGYNALGFWLLRQRATEDRARNVLVSPLSIASALAMVQGGAAGTTRQEIARLTGTGKIDEKAREAESLALFDFLKSAPGVELSLANAMWVRQGFAIKTDFQKRTEKTYSAKVANLDFASPSALEEINGWVKANTGGKIERMVEQLGENDVLVLMNAVYFKGNWLEEFEETRTQNAPFFAPNGKQRIWMMQRSGDFRYVENAAMQAVALPYKGKQMSLYVLLPQKNKSVNSLLSSMDAPEFDALAKSMAEREGSVSLPRFKMQDDIDLIPPLQSLGMKQAFDQRADFSRIAPPPLFLTTVRHKAVIEVNETGTEAAAATEEVMSNSASVTDEESKPFVFMADRPFLLALRDDTTGALLFLGIVNAPEAVN